MLRSHVQFCNSHCFLEILFSTDFSSNTSFLTSTQSVSYTGVFFYLLHEGSISLFWVYNLPDSVSYTHLVDIFVRGSLFSKLQQQKNPCNFFAYFYFLRKLNPKLWYFLSINITPNNFNFYDTVTKSHNFFYAIVFLGTIISYQPTVRSELAKFEPSDWSIN